MPTSPPLGLFADDAVVHSPLYGPLSAAEFFPRLFADAGKSNLELKSVMLGPTVRADRR